MKIVCLDFEGVLVPEIWVNLAHQTEIDELKVTTRDISDYDELMLDLAAIHLKEKIRSKKENEKPKDQVSSNKPNENEKLSNVSPEKDSKEGYEKL